MQQMKKNSMKKVLKQDSNARQRQEIIPVKNPENKEDQKSFVVANPPG